MERIDISACIQTRGPPLRPTTAPRWRPTENSRALAQSIRRCPHEAPGSPVPGHHPRVHRRGGRPCGHPGEGTGSQAHVCGSTGACPGGCAEDSGGILGAYREGVVKAAVAPRTAAVLVSCDCCGRYRRCARVLIDNLGPGTVVRQPLALCSGCCKAAWDAAKARVGRAS